MLRTAALGLFLFGLGGSFGELLLIGHTEKPWQWVPLMLMGSSVLLLGWFLAGRDGAVLRAFRVLMGLFLVSGLLGVYLHYRGNVEFELEMYPSLQGLALFWEALKGATPTLAPGMMIELGVLGLAYAYRHPRLTSARNATDTENGG